MDLEQRKVDGKAKEVGERKGRKNGDGNGRIRGREEN